MGQPLPGQEQTRNRRPGLGTVVCLGLVALLLVLAVPTFAGHSEAQAQTIGLGGAFFFDEGQTSGERKVSVSTEEIDLEFGNETFVSGSIWMLFDTSESVRMGFAYRYFGTYDYIPEDPQDDQDEGTDELGIMMEFLYQLEWLLEMTDEFDLIIGAHAGLAMLIPGGDLEDDINDLQNQGVDVFSTPRLGYVVGPSFGLRWSINDMFAVRGDFGINWEQLLIFLTEQTVQGTPFSIQQHTSILRYDVAFGVEVSF